MFKKSRFTGPLDRQHGKWTENTVSVSTTRPFLYLLIPVNVIELEKVSLSDMKNLKAVC